MKHVNINRMLAFFSFIAFTLFVSGAQADSENRECLDSGMPGVCISDKPCPKIKPVCTQVDGEVRLTEHGGNTCTCIEDRQKN